MSLLEYIFPTYCVVCREQLRGNYPLCPSCDSAKYTLHQTTCRQCGAELARCRCGGHTSPWLSGCASVFYYEDKVRRSVRSFKYSQHSERAGGFASLMLHRVHSQFYPWEPDIIVYVPMLREDRIKRGFNQSQELAQALAMKMHLPCPNGVLKQLYVVDPQHNQPIRSRAGNVFGIYEVKKPRHIRGKRVLLVDDIRTSGATLEECAKMLCLRGAKSVYAITIATGDFTEKERR